jgi:hypothetical protein
MITLIVLSTTDLGSDRSAQVSSGSRRLCYLQEELHACLPKSPASKLTIIFICHAH